MQSVLRTCRFSLHCRAAKLSCSSVSVPCSRLTVAPNAAARHALAVAMAVRWWRQVQREAPRHTPDRTVWDDEMAALERSLQPAPAEALPASGGTPVGGARPPPCCRGYNLPRANPKPCLQACDLATKRTTEVLMADEKICSGAVAVCGGTCHTRRPTIVVPKGARETNCPQICTTRQITVGTCRACGPQPGTAGVRGQRTGRPGWSPGRPGRRFRGGASPTAAHTAASAFSSVPASCAALAIGPPFRVEEPASPASVSSRHGCKRAVLRAAEEEFERESMRERDSLRGGIV